MPIEVAVVAIVCRERGLDRVLLTRRPAGGHLAGFWEFPGGKLEPGEAAIEAAGREAREETGLDLPSLTPLTTTCSSYPDRDLLLRAFLCRLDRPLQVPRANIDHRWQPVESLDEVSLPPANRPIVKALIAVLDQRPA